ncbi:MAG: UDP-2,3-diacylglucosamine diphosphatase [Smithellaceae bacterium]|jgi:UDP-2,3-diacylglucosamine hydrolase|nr:UDP-2,3-diacylglucosamine diphosphatase [Smithellaceae bacterium]MDD3258995.1 UDP-2,3-diacylglucosamine diphosphatase [Smithellaceae bacterium]MDD3848959.1 UDP-2,3-diacylglucosamine diphosphatase [Smithellaceae bacterium]HOG11368.1 UDP-2,3-diacylglucosamine diphosphatase [Smithellaceae bacterium]HPL09408.1 UDP-2,3-diacylglucosamine diphosphatase [Smithellaceae bacterium]
MMKAVFLSDAHLKRSTDEPYGLLVRFLTDLGEGRVGPAAAGKEAAGAGTTVDDLYILGDFFDFWFCRPDRIYPEFQPVIRQLVQLRQSGVRIHLFEGNHDFFMREYFYDVLGMDVVEESASIDLGGRRVFAAHGDTLDRTNVFYLTLRKVLRSRTFYHLQRLIPSPILWAAAGLSSATSKTVTIEDGAVLAEKMYACAVERLFTNHDAVILGHCHRPLLRCSNGEGGKKIFAALGDWIIHRSYLFYEEGKFFMMRYPAGQESAREGFVEKLDISVSSC